MLQSFLLLLARTAYVMVLFFTHIPFVVHHTINATSLERLQQYYTNVVCLCLCDFLLYCGQVFCKNTNSGQSIPVTNEYHSARVSLHSVFCGLGQFWC